MNATATVADTTTVAASAAAEVVRFIAPDTYVGRWTRRIRPGTHRNDLFTAAELATLFTVPAAIWEYSGGVGGRDLYVRTRYVGQADGTLAGYDSDGRCTIIHPADRKIRILTK